jgi:hypothetical protein
VIFTKKGDHSVIPSVALISGQLGADGLLTDWFNPSVASTACGLPQNGSTQRSFDFAQDFGSRLGRREGASTLQKTGIDPFNRKRP